MKAGVRRAVVGEGDRERERADCQVALDALSSSFDEKTVCSEKTLNLAFGLQCVTPHHAPRLLLWHHGARS